VQPRGAGRAGRCSVLAASTGSDISYLISFLSPEDVPWPRSPRAHPCPQGKVAQEGESWDCPLGWQPASMQAQMGVRLQPEMFPSALSKVAAIASL